MHATIEYRLETYGHVKVANTDNGYCVACCQFDIEQDYHRSDRHFDISG